MQPREPALTFHADRVSMIVMVALLTACGPATTPPEPARLAPQAPPRLGPPAAEARRPDGPAASATRPSPPKPRIDGPSLARRHGIADVIHGVRVKDPYRWLEDEKSPAVRAWMKAMDDHARKRLAALPGRDLLAERLAELSYVDALGAPQRRGRRFFFSRQHRNKEKRVHYWRQGENGVISLLLDPNTMSEDGSTSVLGVFPDFQGRVVAYKASENNADESTLYLMDVATRRVSKRESIKGAKYAHPAWTPDGRGFYYTRLPVDPDIPVADRPGHAAVYYHRMGSDPATDTLVHPKTGDSRTFLWPGLSRDGRYLFVTKASGWTNHEVFWKDLRGGARAPFQTLAKAPEGTEATYQVFAWRGWIYVMTNEGAPRYRLFRINPRRPGREKWQEIVREQADAVLNSFSIRGGRLVLEYLRNASSEIRIATLEGKVLRQVQLPGIGSTSYWRGNPEDDTAYFAFTSFIQPPTIYKTSIRRGTRSVYFQLTLPVDPVPFVVNQVRYPSRDGTSISMFLVHRKDLKRDGGNPTLLYGYGGFNVSLTPHFGATYMVWLEQGGVVAIPNLRGGGEYGEAWHRDGMRLKKQNTFDDFLAAARYLIAEGYTSASRLAIRGGSNGGLLVGAAMVQAPNLFRAVACHVPLLDMVRYHKFGSGRTWIPEYGSAEDPEQFKAIYAYSPYHHVKTGTPYPALLMLSADSDDRVDPMHARKFTAAVRHATRSRHPVLFRLEEKAGHGGGDMVKKTVARSADELAFLLKELGVSPRMRHAAAPPWRRHPRTEIRRARPWMSGGAWLSPASGPAPEPPLPGSAGSGNDPWGCGSAPGSASWTVSLLSPPAPRGHDGR